MKFLKDILKDEVYQNYRKQQGVETELTTLFYDFSLAESLYGSMDERKADVMETYENAKREIIALDDLPGEDDDKTCLYCMAELAIVLNRKHLQYETTGVKSLSELYYQLFEETNYFARQYCNGAFWKSYWNFVSNSTIL